MTVSRFDESTTPKAGIKVRRRRQPKTPGSALAQIDKKLSQALDERTEAMHKVSLLTYWQDKLTRATHEVEYLIAAQQKLMGHPVTSVLPLPGNPAPLPNIFGGAPFAEGTGSMPAKQPSLTVGNVADVVGSEAGFS